MKVFLGFKYLKTRRDFFSTENKMCNRISYTRNMETVIFRHFLSKSTRSHRRSSGNSVHYSSVDTSTGWANCFT